MAEKNERGGQKAPPSCDFSLPFTVQKTAAENLVFGWLSIAADKNGQLVVDKQGDVIPVDELEHAAYDFVLDYRDADQMHDGQPIGKLVESVVMTPEKQAAMGLPDSSLPTGWWVGFRVEPDVFKRVSTGELKAFSIGGAAIREALHG